jgi:hypothetical protein
MRLVGLIDLACFSIPPKRVFISSKCLQGIVAEEAVPSAAQDQVTDPFLNAVFGIDSSQAHPQFK